MTARFEHWFFDLDGTLIDSSEGILDCMRFALAQLGRGIPPDETLRSWIGPPLRTSFGPYLGDAELTERAVALYLQRMDESGWSAYRVYDGILDALARLRDEGARLSVVTAKVETYARRIVEHAPFGPWFSEVVGATPDGALSHKADLIRVAMQRGAARPESTVMVGDRHFDMDGARHHGLSSIGVLWGFGSADELREAGAMRLAESPARLFD